MELLKKQWFLVLLATVLVLGMAAPQWFLGFANSQRARNVILVTVLFLMALPLEARTVWQTLVRPWAAILGAAVNMGVCPALAWVASKLLTGDLSIGMMVAAAAPSTLASAAVWTRRAGGNDVTAILITLLTNGTCFIFTPLWLSLTTQTETQLDVRKMIARLAVLVVLPMVLAQLARLMIPAVAEFASKNKTRCSSIAQFGILSMVLVGAVKSSMRLAEKDWAQEVGMFNFLTMIVLVIAVHLASLLFAYLTAKSMAFPRGDCIAVAFGGSQKTLMIGLYVAIEYFGGLVILPMVVYHIAQLVLDTIIAERMNSSHADEQLS